MTPTPHEQLMAATNILIDDILQHFAPKVPRGGPQSWTEDEYARCEILDLQHREIEAQDAMQDARSMKYEPH